MWIVERTIRWKAWQTKRIQKKFERQRQDEYKSIYLKNRIEKKIRIR